MIMSTRDLAETAQAMVAPGKGILAADESNGTMSKRLEAAGIEPSSEVRRAYRDMLLTTPNLDSYVSGVILYDETIRQTIGDGTPFPQAIEKLGILPGIKVDTGAKDLAGAPGEKVTEGLDGLRERITEYVGMGARFAKWRAVITIGEGIPTRYCIDTNAHALARYARLCQEGGLVPIVEPEVLMDGDHTIERCFEVTEAVHRAVFNELYEQGVALDQMVLKPNMVISGKKCPVQAGPDEVAAETVRLLRRTVPAAVPGIAFLSGGQGAQAATEHLNIINSMGPHPWKVTFSYGRALQDPALAAWKGSESNIQEAQAALADRTKANSLATSGAYTSAGAAVGAQSPVSVSQD
jgi:fructose-bisphosphate aldolase class I